MKLDQLSGLERRSWGQVWTILRFKTGSCLEVLNPLRPNNFFRLSHQRSSLSGSRGVQLGILGLSGHGLWHQQGKRVPWVRVGPTHPKHRPFLWASKIGLSLAPRHPSVNKATDRSLHLCVVPFFHGLCFRTAAQRQYLSNGICGFAEPAGCLLRKQSPKEQALLL